MRFNRYDAAVIAVVCALAVLSALLVFTRNSGAYYTVEYDGESLTCPLNEEKTIYITSHGHSLTVAASNGEVFVEDSDCPDRVCVKTGRISRSGQTIVCVPAGVIAMVTGDDHSTGAEADIIAGGAG